MLGLWLFLACVVVFLAVTVVIAARSAGANAARRRAGMQWKAALAAGDAGAVQTAVRAIARSAPRTPAVAAEALVLAARQTERREVIPVLVALLGHSSRAAARAAAMALNDLGAPGLRAVWDGLGSQPEQRAPGVAFLEGHPDWLFERLLEAFAQRGEAAVSGHQDLWRLPGMQHRLALLAQGSDAVNRLRARQLRGLLGTDGNRVA